MRIRVLCLLTVATSFLVVAAISLASIGTVDAFVYETYLEVVGGPVLNPLAMDYSPPGDFVAEIVDCGLGYPADFPPEVAGKIALILRGELYFWEKTQNAAAAGALAAIIYNYEPGLNRGTLTFVTDIPAVSISGVNGSLLLTLLASGPVTVHLRVGPYLEEPTADIKPGVWPNIINVASSEVFDVALCGTESFDVMTIDPATARMGFYSVEEVYPWGWRYEDVATPYAGNPGEGHAAGPDGIMDLVLEFDTPTVVATLELDRFVGGTIPLTVWGFLYEAYDGALVGGQDDVQIIELAPGIPEFSLPLVAVTSLAAALYLAFRKRIGKNIE